MAGDSVGALSKAVGVLQASMGEAYGKLADTLKQNLSIMQSMNDCMELYMTSGLSLGLERAGKGEAGVIVKIVAEDKIKFPIHDIRIEMMLKEDDEIEKDERRMGVVFLKEAKPNGAERNHKRRKTSTGEVMEDQKETEAGFEDSSSEQQASLEWKEVSGRWSSTQFDLTPGGRVESVVAIRLDSPERYDLQVTATFPSPGTGNPLQVTKTLTMDLLSQLKCTWNGNQGVDAEDGGDSLDVTTSMSAKRLREVFSISGREGIQERARGEIATLAGKTVARVKVLPDEDASDRVRIQLEVIDKMGKLSSEALQTILMEELE